MGKPRSLRQFGPLVMILLLGMALRLAPCGRNRFLEDEALYGYWGLQIAAGNDPMLDYEPVDKPPLHPYTLALSFLLFSPPLAGGNEDTFETVARLPSLFASIADIALLYTIGRKLFGDQRIGMLAALLLAVSPFDSLFASTAFTDPMLVSLVLSALLAAARCKEGTAGLLAGFAIATKQQGLLFVPLVVAVGMISPFTHLRPQAKQWAEHTQFSRQRNSASAFVVALRERHWLRFALGFAVVAGAVVWWDWAREQRPGFVQQGLISYGGLGPVRTGALAERAVDWLRLVGDFWVSPWFNGLVASLLVILLGAPVLARRIGWLAQRQRTLGQAWVLAGFTVAYLSLHWLVGFQVWDRYLLGLVPLTALLSAWALVGLIDSVQPEIWHRVSILGLGAFLIVVLASPVLQATRSELPLGGDHGAYDGIDELAHYLRHQAPADSVVYHYWLGYHYRFYLHGAPLRLHWYPDLKDLASDATVYRLEPRYIAFPSWRDDAPAKAALATSGIDLLPVFQTTRRDGTVSFRLYRLEGP